MQKFLDLHVHSIASSGVDSAARLLEEAKQLKITLGICDAQRYECASGVEIHAQSKRELKAQLQRWYRELDYIIVHGGSEEINRAAAGDERVDILAHPELGRRDSGIDTFTAREAARNSVAVEVNLRYLINSWGSARMHAIRNITRNLMLARKYEFDMIATTGAKSRYELRGAVAVFELLKVVGFEEEEAIAAMQKVPEEILRHSKEIKSPSFIAEGVRRVD